MVDVESNLLAGFQTLIEREIDRRVRPLEEYLNVETLARRIHSEPKTIRDWVHKKIPFEKLPPEAFGSPGVRSRLG